MTTPIRLGMVGGGEGAFIGAVHRIAARLDGHFVLTAGALASDPARARRAGEALGLAPERIYASFAEMALREAERSDGIEAVAIVTPNHLHAEAAAAFLRSGIHVICDKPLATSLDEAVRLRALSAESGAILAVTYNYSGYPMVRQARAMVRDGLLGDIRIVQASYAQDWLAEPIEVAGQKQARWRTDPALAGPGGCIGDIGTHAFHLAQFISGLEPESLLADLSTFVPGRRLDDNAHILLRYPNGARGMLWASQVAPGNENNLSIKVYGSKGGLEWAQEHPNQLTFSALGEPARILSRGTNALDEDARRITRLPPGHPEGYLEAFATIYADVAAAIHAADGGKPDPLAVFPSVGDGIRGAAFIDAALRSSRAGGWVPLFTSGYSNQ